MSERTRSLVTILALEKENGAHNIGLVGVGDAGPWALLARAVSGVPGMTVADMGGVTDEAFSGPHYAPGIRRAGDLRTAATLCAPNGLCVFNAASWSGAEQAERGFRAAGAPLKVEKGSMTPEEIAAWLVRSGGTPADSAR